MRVKDRIPHADFHVDSVAYPVERSGESIGSLLRVSAPDSLTIQTAQAQSVVISGLPRIVFAQILAQMAVAMAKDNAHVPLSPNEKRHPVKTGDLPEVACRLPDNSGNIFLMPHQEFMTIGGRKEGTTVAISMNRHYSPNTFIAIKGLYNAIQRLSLK